jgi:acetoin utilization deacetylase AcuC-like enzyme
VATLPAGVAVNTAGGTHHAHFAHGSGFCIFNDLAITAKRVLARGAVERVLIVDLDVHQGDGGAVTHSRMSDWLHVRRSAGVSSFVGLIGVFPSVP